MRDMPPASADLAVRPMPAKHLESCHPIEVSGLGQFTCASANDSSACVDLLSESSKNFLAICRRRHCEMRDEVSTENRCWCWCNVKACPWSDVPAGLIMMCAILSKFHNELMKMNVSTSRVDDRSSCREDLPCLDAIPVQPCSCGDVDHYPSPPLSNSTT